MLAAEQAFWQMERAAQFKYASLNVSKNRNSKRLSHPAPPQTSAVPTRAAVPIPRALPWIDIGISEVDENFKKTKGMTTKKKNAGRARIRTGEDGFIDSVKDANVGASDANLNASTYDDDDEEEDDDESTPPAQNIKGMLGFQPLRGEPRKIMSSIHEARLNLTLSKRDATSVTAAVAGDAIEGPKQQMATGYMRYPTQLAIRGNPALPWWSL